MHTSPRGSDSKYCCELSIQPQGHHSLRPSRQTSCPSLTVHRNKILTVHRKKMHFIALQAQGTTLLHPYRKAIGSPMSLGTGKPSESHIPTKGRDMGLPGQDLCSSTDPTETHKQHQGGNFTPQRKHSRSCSKGVLMRESAWHLTLTLKGKPSSPKPAQDLKHGERSCFTLAGSFNLPQCYIFPCESKTLRFKQVDFQAVDPIPTCGRKLQQEQKQSTCCYIHNPGVSQTLSHLSGNFKHAACLDSAVALRVLHTGKLLCAHGDLSKQSFSKMLSGFSMGFAFDKDSYQLSQKKQMPQNFSFKEKKT